jgi:NADPH-dependent glutamate synthase beta subunit-like oxidoreductase/glutamate synthase domain-containing protein 3/Pyruvate/2-oxoacid:ferredoxin oxidoreductase delta subunit
MSSRRNPDVASRKPSPKKKPEAARATAVIAGVESGRRVDSRVLEERMQQAVTEGHRLIEVQAFGQHGIGGRLWKAGDEPVTVRITGSPGQRVGSMGFPNTFIEVMGPASDDVGWLNAGARIVVHGQATNGIGNAMAQGKIYVAGDIGARGMTMTKQNPRFAPPELWVLGGAGDSFAEFMAGGTAVICGHEAHHPDNVLGHRPGVGMVGGRIFFRGPHKGFSNEDARLAEIGDGEWNWLTANLKEFLRAIGRSGLQEALLADRAAWKLLVARTPGEKGVKAVRKMSDFHRFVWDRELGPGGLIGDLTDLDRSPVPLITTGILRRYIPVWENLKFLPPCQASCPTGIPVQKRWEMVRKGLIDEAVDIALAYTPFPVTVCGYLCPNVCMQHCTRAIEGMKPVDITVLGKSSLQAKPPEPAPSTGYRVAIVGGGPAGLSIAWQLYLKGHQPVVYDRGEELGGKITSSIPSLRIPDEIVRHEIDRVKGLIPKVHLNRDMTRDEFTKIRDEFDTVVIATGAQKPRMLPLPGIERALPALDFLRAAKANLIRVGKRVVVIGAGNVGCDAASEAARLGAEAITLIDIQQPASFGKERQHAEAAGAKFLWPVATRAITAEGVELTRGDVLPADTVVVAVGDTPDLSFLPRTIVTERGFVVVNERFQTSDPKVYAVGDTVKLGLLTEAIGAGRKAAEAIDALLKNREVDFDSLPPIPAARIKLEYYDPRVKGFGDADDCAGECASCGSCRDCSVCVTVCPQNAISRKDLGGGAYEYAVDPDRCIGCGFCAGACPCGIWQLVENVPLESINGAT